jgi:uncharacterized protein
MDLSDFPTHYLALIGLIGFGAGLLDSIAGGGGLIGTPAMLNLFPHWQLLNVVSTNRCSSIFGTTIAAWNYFRTIPPEWNVLVPACFGALLASFLGVQWASQIPDRTLKIIVLISIVLLAVWTWFNKRLGEKDQRRFSSRGEWWAALGIGTVCGFYNGLIGPGTGTLLVFAFVAVLGMDFLRSSAVSKATNVAGDISSFAVLVLGGFVVWRAAIPLILGNMLGSFAGSKLAILKGSGFVRRFFLCVTVALVARFAWQLWTSG